MSTGKHFPKQSEAWWADVRTRYIQGDMPLNELHKEIADKCSRNNLTMRSKRGQWHAARLMYRKGLADEKERQSIDLATDGVTVEAQADCRKRYLADADSIMSRVRDIIKDESIDLNSIDLQRLATTTRTCQQIEFASLRIPIDSVDLTADVRGPMTWLDMMTAQRKKKGLPEGGP